MNYTGKTNLDLAREAREKRCAPLPWTFNETFFRYGQSKRMIPEINLQTLLKVPDLIARAERSGCEACYVEVARWSWIRQRWESFCFVKCFGGEIKEFPDIGDVATCDMIANLINQRMGEHGSFVHELPPFNSEPDAKWKQCGPGLLASLKTMLSWAENQAAPGVEKSWQFQQARHEIEKAEVEVKR